MIYISPLCLLCRSQWAGAREGALRLDRNSMRHGLQPNIARVGQEMSMFKESNSVYFLKKQLYLFYPVSSCNLKTARLSQTLKTDFSETLVIHLRDVPTCGEIHLRMGRRIKFKHKLLNFSLLVKFNNFLLFIFIPNLFERQRD